MKYFDEAFDFNLDSKPIVGGVYFLIHKGRVVYVGQSDNVYARIFHHATNQGYGYDFYKEFDSVRILPCKRSDRDEIEQRCIAHFRPLYNGYRTKNCYIRRFASAPA